MEIGEAAVRAGTGHGWDHWFSVLDAHDGPSRGHPAMARHLAREHGLSGWWSQEVTVIYERARGLRVEGQVADGSFQVGASKTLPLSPEEAWELLSSGDWLGEGAPDGLSKGQSFSLADGTACEVRVLVSNSRLRMGFHPPGWDKPSTLQVRVNPGKPGKTALSFHHERLPDAHAREAMRQRWKDTLAQLA